MKRYFMPRGAKGEVGADFSTLRLATGQRAGDGSGKWQHKFRAGNLALQPMSQGIPLCAKVRVGEA